MPSVDEPRNMKPWEWTMTVAAFLAIIAPGVLILYLYKPSLVTELDSPKLLVFSAALTLSLGQIGFIAAYACVCCLAPNDLVKSILMQRLWFVPRRDRA